ncbi:hypothetical protein GALL_26190 [mine drainage metagenome]|uniref:Uncharacterized protein n=1 Tax=mine drainage metagenome TaxID=410659 RepID=A0A1J5T7F1_9ZZZZ
MQAECRLPADKNSGFISTELHRLLNLRQKESLLSRLIIEVSRRDVSVKLANIQHRAEIAQGRFASIINATFVAAEKGK